MFGPLFCQEMEAEHRVHESGKGPPFFFPYKGQNYLRLRLTRIITQTYFSAGYITETFLTECISLREQTWCRVPERVTISDFSLIVHFITGKKL